MASAPVPGDLNLLFHGGPLSQGTFYSAQSSMLLNGSSCSYIFPPQVEDAAIQCMRQVFHFTGFKGQQKKCICSCIMGNNMLLISSTGSGKSLCYQLPALVGRWSGSGFMHGVTVVISPLISLINDQVAALKTKSISAVSFSVPNASRNAIPSAFSDVLSNNPSIKLIYMTPERFCNPEITQKLKELHERKKFLRLVVDECHCITMWGHEFRSQYMLLGAVLKKISPTGMIPVLAVTATATATDTFLIKKSLNIAGAPMLVGTFYRDNLKYVVNRRTHNNKKAVSSAVARLCEQFPAGSGIVYCMSQKLSEDIAILLRKEGITSVAYHAGLSPAVRSVAQNDWMEGNARVVCATVALGMGVDKPDVRFVVHASISHSLEHYYQETGRAGRDGNMSICLLMYDHYDYDSARQLLQSIVLYYMSKTDRIVEGLDKMTSYAELRVTCRRQFLVKHFGEMIDPSICRQSDASCDICDKLKNEEMLKVDITHFAKTCTSVVGHGLQHSKGIPHLRIKTLVAVLQGKRNVSEEFIACRAFGLFKNDREEDLITSVRNLITAGVLQQFLYRSKFSSDHCQCLLKLSSISADILNGKHKVALVCTRSDMPSMPQGTQITNILVLDCQLTSAQRQLRMAIMGNSLCKQLIRKRLISIHDVTNLCVLLPLSVTEVSRVCANVLPSTAYHTLVELFKCQAKEEFDKLVQRKTALDSFDENSDPYTGVVILQNPSDIIP